MKQFIDQLTAWVTLAALLTGCATPGEVPGGGNGVLDIIAALERDTAERRIPQAEGMAAVPAEMRSAIQGLLASPEGAGADNLKLAYAKPYMIEEEQAPAPRPYPPRPPLRRESGNGINGRWALWLTAGILSLSSGLLILLDPLFSNRGFSDLGMDKMLIGVLLLSGGPGLPAIGSAFAPVQKYRSFPGNIERNRRVTREWEAQKREIDAENETDRSAVDARNRERQAVLDASVNRYRGYIEVVDRGNGTVRIIWPDLIAPEPRAAGQ